MYYPFIVVYPLRPFKDMRIILKLFILLFKKPSNYLHKAFPAKCSAFSWNPFPQQVSFHLPAWQGLALSRLHYFYSIAQYENSINSGSRTVRRSIFNRRLVCERCQDPRTPAPPPAPPPPPGCATVEWAMWLGGSSTCGPVPNRFRTAHTLQINLNATEPGGNLVKNPLANKIYIDLKAKAMRIFCDSFSLPCPCEFIWKFIEFSC